MKKLFLFVMLAGVLPISAQEKPMTKELLWQLGRLGTATLSEDGKNLYYSVSNADVATNTWHKSYFVAHLDNGTIEKLESFPENLSNKNTSPNKSYVIEIEDVPVEKILSKDIYPELKQSNAYVFDELAYRHWDTWHNGSFQHLFLKDVGNNRRVDLLQDEPYHAPQKPFGGEEDFVWSPDGKQVIYVSKKVKGTDYALSTNTDLYAYDISTKKTVNLTPNNPGYDTHPSFSPQGKLTWLQMKRDGYEADKNDIIVRDEHKEYNLTAHWDGTVESYIWSKDGKRIYFVAPVLGTKQVFEVFGELSNPKITQITNGDFDINEIVGFSNNNLIVKRSDFNHANELFSYNLDTNDWKQISQINTEIYKSVAKSKVEQRFIETTDGKKMLVYVIYPPNFNPKKKYPTLLYCQGGPQSALSQFYSFRWNFQLMAAEGYIVVAPNRRGMPGFGVKWNEDISLDWGGKAMQDYLVAIDEVSKESYVDNERLGAIGASYGGYSVYFLAGIHEGRFKTFISHCGVFNLESMYGTTEEVFFPNWDAGGAYWEKNNVDAVKTYAAYNPKNYVNEWNTPILVIHGGKDYRVPIGQGQEAFQAAQLKGIKSRFLYFPEENHWILDAQNAQVWQTEFFKWLKETL